MTEAEADLETMARLAGAAVRASFEGGWTKAYQQVTAHYDRVCQRCRTDPDYRKAFNEAWAAAGRA